MIYASAGDVPRASRILDWMYGPRVPAPKAPASMLSTQAMDGFSAAANLGDRTKGLPLPKILFPKHDAAETRATEAGCGPLEDRVRAAEAKVRLRLASDRYAGDAPADDAWESMEPGAPERRIDLWRRTQRLVREDQEKAALDRLDRYLDELQDDHRGIGYGDEIPLALYLALRNGAEERVPVWLARHGHRFAKDSSLLVASLCLPAVAAAIVSGAFRDTIALDETEKEAALRALEEAIEASLTPAPKAVPKVQKRRVSCEFAQVHLEPETPDAEEKEQVYFQDETDTARGMSLFPTKAGIATPSETDYVDAEISVLSRGLSAKDLERVAQAVAFPIVVRGPLVLRSVSSGDDDEPIVIPPGAYEVLARFFPKKAPRASAAADLRVFRLALTFHPDGALDAPKTLRLDAEP